MGRRGCQTVTE